MVSILVFIASHAIGQGAVIWVLFRKYSRIMLELMDNHLVQEYIGFFCKFTLMGPVVIDLFKEILGQYSLFLPL
jgi:hypothetical protein